jgi:hypothetical protein
VEASARLVRKTTEEEGAEFVQVTAGAAAIAAAAVVVAVTEVAVGVVTEVAVGVETTAVAATGNQISRFFLPSRKARW